MQIGDKLYDYELKEYTVSKIGRKYFYLERKSGHKVDKNTLMAICDGYSQANFQLYKDEQAVYDEREHYELLEQIRQHFSMWEGKPVTLQQLRDVAGIIGIESKNLGK